MDFKNKSRQEKVIIAMWLIKNHKFRIKSAAAYVGMTYGHLRQNINRLEMLDQLEQKIRCFGLDSSFVKASAMREL